MRRHAQPPPPEYRPSTTRAVAWTAMLFASISLAISLFLLVTSWQNGKMLNNARELWDDVKPAIDKIQAEKAQRMAERAGKADHTEKTDKPADTEVQWERLRERIEELQTRITSGDKSARYYLDNLKHDLDLMRDYTTTKSSKWFEDAGKTLATAREEMGRNAPAAAARLKQLADQVKTRDATEKPTPSIPREDETGSKQ